jgi:hypothetical protein
MSTTAFPKGRNRQGISTGKGETFYMQLKSIQFKGYKGDLRVIDKKRQNKRDENDRD